LPFSDHCEPLVDTQEQLRAILRGLKNTVGEDCAYIELRPLSPLAELSDFSESQSYYWHSLDLSPASDVLLKSFHRDCVQRKIRRADRESLAYETGNSDELLTQFYRLLIKARRRHSLPPQPYYWFQQLARTFAADLQVRVASFEGRPVASIVTLKHGKTITYKYGGSDARLNRLGGMALLLWQTILEAKDEGMTLLDLGRADEDNAGLITFKEHWNARRTALRYLTFPARPHREGRPLSSPLLKALGRHAPDWSLVLAGKLLYPHLG
jgi:lipid II:glycine glycyltransferase (peptidoglycan interpeptide bridge formation enzyme)